MQDVKIAAKFINKSILRMKHKLYLSPIPVVHSEVRFQFKRVHQLLTNSLYQSAAQNLLVADEAIDVFTIAGSNVPRPKEWIFEEGERVIVSSEKEGTIAAVESTHLEVDLATNEGIKTVSWYNVRKVFSPLGISSAS